MKEYIERDAFIEKCTTILPDKSSDYKDGVFNAIKIANALPKADVKEVVHGKWINDGDTLICNKCGTAYEHPIFHSGWNYCPDCGAIMDESEG